MSRDARVKATAKASWALHNSDPWDDTDEVRASDRQDFLEEAAVHIAAADAVDPKRQVDYANVLRFVDYAGGALDALGKAKAAGGFSGIRWAATGIGYAILALATPYKEDR